MVDEWDDVKDLKDLAHELFMEKQIRDVLVGLLELEILRKTLFLECKGAVRFSVSFLMIALIAAQTGGRVIAYLAMTFAILGGRPLHFAASANPRFKS